MSVDVVHALPGRIRLRVSDVKHNPEQASELRDRIAQLDGIRDVSVNPLTGSVLLHYESNGSVAPPPGLTSVFPELHDTDLEVERHVIGNGRMPEPDTRTGVESLMDEWKAKLGAGGGQLDLKSLLPLALASLAILDFVRRWAKQKELPLPNWYELFWFAFSSYMAYAGATPETETDGEERDRE